MSRSHPVKSVVIAAIASVAFGIMPVSVLAQQQTVNVLIDASYGLVGKGFLEEMRNRLEPEARAAVNFETRIVEASKISSVLRKTHWDMAILSTAALTAMRTRSSAAAFELPFVFPSTQSAITVQQSPLGRAALGRLSAEQGMTGLVYLNAGVSLVAGYHRGTPNSPRDLKGRKIAVFSHAEERTLQMLGSSPVMLSPKETAGELKAGRVDSALISSAQPTTWILPQQRFLLADSVKARVAVVVTRDASWDHIPFVYRAMIGDAAITASQQLDRAVLKTEGSLFGQARSAGTLVTFSKDDAERATREWISQQPQAVRGHYSLVFDDIKKIKRQDPSQPTVPRKGGQAGRIHFATTRDDTGHNSFQYRFGDARTDIVKCGQIGFTSSNRSRSSDLLIGPVTADSTACGTHMNEVLKSSKRTLLFVHGFNNRFAEAAERAMLLKNALGDETEVVLWSWPSKREGQTGNYDYDKESVSGVARPSLVRYLKAMRPGSESVPLDILAHSMGSWHILGVLQDLADDASRPMLGNIALAAPDVPTDEFMFALSDMRRGAKRVTLYACEWDWALLLSQGINAYPRAGTGGSQSIVVNEKLESVDVDARFFSTNHSYVFEAGKVLTDFTAMVIAGRDAGSRGLRKKTKQPWYYWSFP